VFGELKGKRKEKLGVFCFVGMRLGSVPFSLRNGVVSFLGSVNGPPRVRDPVFGGQSQIILDSPRVPLRP